MEKTMNKLNTTITEKIEDAIYGEGVLNNAIEAFVNNFKRMNHKPNGEIVNTEGYVEIELDDMILPVFKISIDVDWEWVYDFDVDYTIEQETSEITIDCQGDWISIEY